MTINKANRESLIEKSFKVFDQQVLKVVVGLNDLLLLF